MWRWLRSVNEVFLLWWVANDPILKETKNNQNLVVFNIATRRVWTTKDGERKEEVQYHKAATWWKLAERAEKILEKWSKVHVRGYLHNRKIQIEWEEKPRIITEIIVNDLLVLDRKRNNNYEENDESEGWDSYDENFENENDESEKSVD